MSIEKKLKVKDGVNGKILTVDAKGNIISSGTAVSEISSLADRITALESTTTELESKVKAINGEVVE